jgi:hypothetical protein
MTEQKSPDPLTDELAKHQAGAMLDAAMPGAGMLLDLLEAMEETQPNTGSQTMIDAQRHHQAQTLAAPAVAPVKRAKGRRR